MKEVLPDGTIKTIGSGFSHPAGVAVDARATSSSPTTDNNACRADARPPRWPPTPSSTRSRIVGAGGLGEPSRSTAVLDAPGDHAITAASSPRGRAASPPARRARRQSFITAAADNRRPRDAVSVSATGATSMATVNPNGSTTTARSSTPPAPRSRPRPTSQHRLGVHASRTAWRWTRPATSSSPTHGNAAVDEVLPERHHQHHRLRVQHPAGVAVDAAGDVFVADQATTPSRRSARRHHQCTIGSGFSGPTGVAVDAAGDVFVADYNNNAVKEVLPDGTIKHHRLRVQPPVWRGGGRGRRRLRRRHSATTPSRRSCPTATIKTIGSGFSSPTGVAVDAAGDVFVADTGNDAVKEVLPDGDIKTIGSGLVNPTGVAVDAAGDVFVADSDNDRVVELSPPTVAATPSPLTGSTATAVSATLTGLTPGTTYYFRLVASSAEGVAVDIQSPPQSFTTKPPPCSRRLGRRSILRSTRKARPRRQSISVLISASQQAWRSTRPATSSSPTLAITPSRSLAQRHHQDHRLSTSSPSGVAVDAAGDVFVADTGHNAVKEVLPNGTILTIGSGFSQPRGVAVDAAGDVFVADTGHNAIKEVLPNGTIITIGSRFKKPMGVAVDAAGDVFVADSGNRAVKEVLPNGTIKSIGSGFSDPRGVAVDATGNVFVAAYGKNAVKKVLPNGTIQSIGAGFSGPTGVAVDESGDVFVAASHSNRVVKVAPRTVAATFTPPRTRR